MPMIIKCDFKLKCKYTAFLLIYRSSFKMHFYTNIILIKNENWRLLYIQYNLRLLLNIFSYELRVIDTLNGNV